MKGTETVSSLDNPIVKRIKRLQTKASFRKRETAFWVDELPVTLTAIKAQAPVETIVYAQELLKDETGRSALDRQKRDGTPCLAVSEKVFRHLSERNNPEGLGVICRDMWSDDIDALHPNSADIIVVLECISDPGNLGTILRVLDSVKNTTLILAGQSSSPSHPRTVRASRGTVFTVPLYCCADMHTVFCWANKHQIQTVATSAKADTSFWEAGYRTPVMCVFGNEHRGLDPVTKQAADQLVTIPMEGTASSLNVTISVSLLLYEIKRRNFTRL